MRAQRRVHQTKPRAGLIGHLGVSREWTCGHQVGPVLIEHVEECRVVATVEVRKSLGSRLKFPPVTI